MSTTPQSNVPFNARVAVVSFIETYCRQDMTLTEISFVESFLETIAKSGWKNANIILAEASIDHRRLPVVLAGTNRSCSLLHSKPNARC